MSGQIARLAAAAMLAAAPAGACYLHTGIAGLTTGDPLAIPVLVAARSAAEAGVVVRIASGDGPALAEAVATLGYLPLLTDGARFAGAPQGFAVLQAQTGYWARYELDGATVRAEGHAAGPAPGDAVIVVPDAALLAVLLDGVPVAKLRATGLIRARGANAEVALDAFAALVEGFAASEFGLLLAANPPPRLLR